jgi:hypothetical protein
VASAAPVSSEPFHALSEALKDGGFRAQGERLDDVLNGTWTTSTELIGELGLVVVEIRRKCAPLNATQKALVKRCLHEVRKAWPGFGWFSWWPWRESPRR